MTSSNENAPLPPWAQVGMLLIALLLAAGLIVLPVVGMAVLEDRYGLQPTGESVWGAMIAILLGLTTMTVSGIFVFMTFRIDRGARTEARKIAEKVVEQMQRVAIERVQRKIDGLLDETQIQLSENLVKVKKEISDREAELLEQAKLAVAAVGAASSEGTAKVADALAQGVGSVQDMFEETRSQIAVLGNTVEGTVTRANAAMKQEIDAGRAQIQQVFAEGRQELSKAFDEAKDGGEPTD